MLEIKYCYVCNKNVWCSLVFPLKCTLKEILNQDKKLNTKPISDFIWHWHTFSSRFLIMKRNNNNNNNNNNKTIVILLYNYPLKAMKNGKASGIDSLQAELLKADTTTASLVLTDFFAKIWNHEVIPKDWSMGIYLAECTDPNGGIVIFGQFCSTYQISWKWKHTFCNKRCRLVRVLFSF